MQFLSPLALVFLLTIPVIILFYLLKQKKQQQMVSSTLLWQKALADTISQTTPQPAFIHTASAGFALGLGFNSPLFGA